MFSATPMRIALAFHLFNGLAILNQFQFSRACPILSRRVAVPVHPGDSYITTITVIGSLIVVLFVAKWVYVSRRQRKQRLRSQKFASMWRDDFSSFQVGRKDSSNNGNPVKSAFLVGLFGSPSWETRYSAIVDKVSGSQLQSLRQDFIGPGPVGSVRSKSASEKSDKVSPVSSPIFKFNSGVNSMTMHRVDNTRPKSLSESTTEILVPSPVLGSMDYLSWKKSLLTGRHASYPTGLCIESRTGSWSFKTQTPATYLPSDSSGPFTVESLQSYLVAQEEPMSSTWKGPMKNNLGFVSQDLCWDSTSAEKELPHLSIEYALLDDSTQSQNHVSPPLHVHPYSQTPAYTVTSDIDKQQSKPMLPPLQSETPHSDLGYTARPSPAIITSAKLQSRISPPREHGRSRTRRSSPKVGPSPLRRMFLPSDDFISEDLEVPFSPLVEQDSDSNVQRQSFNTNHPIQCSAISHMQTPVTFDARSARKTRPSMGKLNASDNLLDFLDELVQETSEWDASLFVDDNFKAMIDHSKSSDTSPSAAHVAQVKRSTLSRRQRVSFTMLEGIPEVDVTECLSRDSEVPFDESYWSDEDEFHREAMGIAR